MLQIKMRNVAIDNIKHTRLNWKLSAFLPCSLIKSLSSFFHNQMPSGNIILLNGNIKIRLVIYNEQVQIFSLSQTFMILLYIMFLSSFNNLIGERELIHITLICLNCANNDKNSSNGCNN